MTDKINWKTNKEERKLLRKTVDRIIRLHKPKPLTEDDRINITMTLTACHLNGTPLDFEKMLVCDEFTLFHDLVGIEKHMNIDTGKIERCFLPRCAA
jgi:hypothetical protein